MTERRLEVVATYRIVCTGCGSAQDFDKVPLTAAKTQIYRCDRCGHLDADWNVGVLPRSIRGRTRYFQRGRRRTIRATPRAQR